MGLSLVGALLTAAAAAGSSEESRKSASKQASKGRRLTLQAMAKKPPESVQTIRGSGENVRRQKRMASGRTTTTRAGIAMALKRRLGE